MTSKHGSKRLVGSARIIRRLAIPIILFWVALTAVVNIAVPQLSEVAKVRAVSLNPDDAPALIAMKRIGRNFDQFNFDTTAMVVLEADRALADDAHHFYDELVDKLSADTAHVEYVENFWADPLTAAGSQSIDGKAAYVQLYLTGNQGDLRSLDSVEAVQRIVESVKPPPGVKAYVTGIGPLTADRRVYGDESVEKVTLVTVAVIALMLLFIYRSIPTALSILLVMGIQFSAARGLIAFFADHSLIRLSVFAVNVIVALTIAAATDYVIFLVGRYQEARAAGEHREAAYYSMFIGTIPVVLGSGLTVAGAMFCLSFTRLPYFSSLGAPCPIGLLVVMFASLTLTPAVVAVTSRLGVFDGGRRLSTRRWRRIGTVVVRWPGPVLVATVLVSMIGLFALPGFQIGYNERYYIPDHAPSNVGYRAADRHFPQARIQPELLMLESDHDLRNPADMLVLEKVAKTIFHVPGVARVQAITRPMGSPIDHSSIPFQISVQSAVMIENIKYLKDRVADLTAMTSALQDMIDLTERTELLQQNLASVTHDMAGHARQMRDNTNQLRDRLADFDDTWRPIRNYFHWERNCFNIPVCWSFHSILDSVDGVDSLSEDVGNLVGDLSRTDAITPELLAQMPPMIATMKTIKGIAQTMTSSFSGLVTQLENLTRNATEMGRAFDASHNDDTFYLPPEAFDNPDFQRGLKLFLSPDGQSARFVITHEGDAATAEGISHINAIVRAAADALKGTPLAVSNIYITGTASTYKDMHDASTYDLMIAIVASLCLIFLIMLALTRSLVAAAVIVGTVTLSLGSSIGLSVLIWQHILHCPLHWLVLSMAIIVMLAVGSDYNLLLISRFGEEMGAGLKTGMIRSMAKTGKVVTIAGLVFAFTMGATVVSDLRIVSQIGTTIMIGLLFDTLIVRSFMTPAIATLLGRWFWWPRICVPARSRRAQKARAADDFPPLLPPEIELTSIANFGFTGVR